jgi:hypothetical protein
MARKRMLDPSFLADANLGECSIAARYLFSGMVLLADDEGRLSVNLKYLRKEIFGYDNITIEEVGALLSELRAHLRSLVFYEHDGREYLWFAKWEQYQQIAHPYRSTLPEPPGYTTGRVFKERSSRLQSDKPEAEEHSMNVQRTVNEHVGLNERSLNELNGNEENGFTRAREEPPSAAVALAEVGLTPKQIKRVLDSQPRQSKLTPEACTRLADWKRKLDADPAVHSAEAIIYDTLVSGGVVPGARNGRSPPPRAVEAPLTMEEVEAGVERMRREYPEAFEAIP